MGRRKYIRNIVIIPFLSVILTASKLIASFIPNVELVTFLLIIYVNVFGFKKSILILYIFLITEAFIYPLGTWVVGYIWIWTLLIVVTSLIKKYIKTEYGWAIFSGLYGFLFGFLFAVNESFITQISIYIYWLRGLTFDIIHMFSNYVLMLLLYKPIKNKLIQINDRF